MGVRLHSKGIKKDYRVAGVVTNAMTPIGLLAANSPGAI